MNYKQKRSIEILAKEKEKSLSGSSEKIVDFFKDSKKISEKEKPNKLLNDLKNYPHAFVLACIMDSMINAEKAWLIPYKISTQIGGFEFPRFTSLGNWKEMVSFSKSRPLWVPIK